MSSAFIPIFSKLESSTKPDATATQKSDELNKEEFFALIFWLMSGVMTLIVLAGILLAPLIAKLLFSLQTEEVTKLAETTLLIRILFPYIGLISLCALQQSVLENHGKFSFSASVPVLFNLILIVVITGVIWFDSLRIPYINWFIDNGFYQWWGYEVSNLASEGELHELAKTLIICGGVIIGGVVQLVYVGMGVHALRYKIFGTLGLFSSHKKKLSQTFSHPTLKRFVYLLIPVFLASGSYQLQTLLLDPITLSLGKGAVSLLYYANRLLEFPLGIIGVAITTTSLPILARAANNLSADKGAQSFSNIIESSLKGVWLLFIPIMLVSGLFPHTIISLVFEFQAFNGGDVFATMKCFLYMLPSLPVLAGYRILFNGFYATENTKLPLYVSLTNLFFGLPFAFAVIQFFPYPEMIALTGTVSSFLIFVLTVYLFKKKLGISLYPLFKHNLSMAVKVLVGVLPILYFTHRLISPFFSVLYKTSPSLWVTKLWQLLELGLFSVWVFFLYGVFLILFKEPQVLKILERLKTKSIS